MNRIYRLIWSHTRQSWMIVAEISRRQGKRAALALPLLAAPLSGHAAVTFWNNDTDSWFNSGNWSEGLPSTVDNPHIDNGGTAQVGSSGAEGYWIYIGQSNEGSLEISSGGTLRNNVAFIGDIPNSIGTVRVDGDGATWSNSSNLYVGFGGSGVLNIINGGKVTNIDGHVGENSSSTGTVTVKGNDSTWTNIDELQVGVRGNGTLTIANGGTVNVKAGNAGTVMLGNYASGTGTLNIGDGGSAGILNTASVTSGDGTAILNFNHNDSDYYFTNSGTGDGTDIAITGSTAVNQIGSGTTILTGANTYTGGTTVSAGTLQGDNSSLQGNIVNNARVVFDQTTDGSYAGVMSGSGSLTKSGTGTLILSGTNSYTGGTTVNTGILRSGAADALVNDTVYTVNGGTLDLNGNDLTMSSLSGSGGTITQGTAALTVDQSGNTDYAGIIDGSGSLTKSGTGTLILSGANRYSGDTTVSGGTLQVDGSLGVTATTVGNGATLAGSGAIGGAVTVANGGTVAPGSGGAGTLTVDALTLGSGSALNYELGPVHGANDRIDVNGNLVLDGNLNVTDAGSFGPGVYRLMNYGGALTDNGLDLGVLPSAVKARDLTVQTSVANQVNLISTAGAVLNFWDGGDVALHNNNVIDGGDKVWDAANRNWTTADGIVNGGWSGGFAVFQGKAGTVTVDNGAGRIQARGMQFDVDGYVIEGEDIALSNPDSSDSIIRVGDGTSSGAGYKATIASNLSGAERLVKTDLGTLALTGTNTYSGGTLVSGGTLQGNTASLQGNIENNASVVFDQTVDGTYAGAMSGSGNLTKSGVGALTLTSANRYSGGTAVRAGALSVEGGSISHIDGETIIGQQTGDNAALDIRSGGKVSNSRGAIGLAPGSTGAVTVDGAGSIWSNKEPFVVGSSGTGTLDIINGGVVSVVSNTSLTAGVIGENSGSIGKVTVDGERSAWSNGELVIGDSGTGTLNITSGGSVSSFTSYIGKNSGGNGAVTVDGAGSNWRSGDSIIVGASGTGILNIVNGGKVHDVYSAIGDDSGGTGTAVVAGAGSAWTSSNYLIVGNSGTSSLQILNGGKVTSFRGGVGRFGMATVDGNGSSWSNEIDFGVAVGGQLTVTNGASVSNSSGISIIGGTATVDGAGSTWSNGDELIMGGRTGVLNVINGGKVSSNRGYVGFLSNWGANAAIVEGKNSTWLNRGEILVGDAGIGTLHINNGGKVVAGDGVLLATSVVSIGTLNIGNGGAAGILDAATVKSGLGTATVNFNHNDSGYYFTNNGSIDGTAIAITGSTAVNQIGSGTTILTGANTYTGGTRVLNGTLQGNSTSLQGNIDNRARVVFDQTTNGTYAGIMSGNGSLTKSGGGTLIMTGANRYSGGTTVSDGTLQGNTTSVQGDIVNNARVVFDQTTNGTYAGAMSGRGTLTKTGAGTLNLTGANPYDGDTHINEGTLSVNGSIAGDTFVHNSGTLGGAGTVGNVAVGNGGTLAPGNNSGILTVNGNLVLNDGSTTMMEINGTTPGNAHDQINVSGTTALDGRLNLAFGYTPTSGSRYNLINAGNVVQNGNADAGFRAITSNLGAALLTTPIIDLAAFNILIEQQSYITAAGGSSVLTRNQHNVAASLDSFSTSGHAADLIGALNMLSKDQLPPAFDSLSGVQHTHAAPQALRVTRQFQGLLTERMAGFEAGQTTSQLKPSNDIWLRGMGGGGDIEGDGNASGASFSTGGLAIGADRHLSESLLAGLAFGYTRSNLDVEDGDQDIDSYQLAAYGSWQGQDAYLDGSAGIGRHSTQTQRHITVGTFKQKAEADYDIDGVGFALETGKHFALFSKAMLTPFAGFEYGHVSRESFEESGAGSANLRADADSTDSVRSKFGVRLAQHLTTQNGMEIEPSVSAAWVHEYADSNARLGATFAGVPGAASFLVDGPELDRDRAQVNLGVSARLTEMTRLDLGYQGEIADSDTQHTAFATFRMSW